MTCGWQREFFLFVSGLLLPPRGVRGVVLLGQFEVWADGAAQ